VTDAARGSAAALGALATWLSFRTAATPGGVEDLLPTLGRILLSVAVAWGLEAAFARARRRKERPVAWRGALLFGALLPAGAPLLQAAAGMAFGHVIAHEVLGRRDRGLVHPAVLGLAFLGLAFPGSPASATTWLPDPLPASWWSAAVQGAGSPLGSVAAAAILVASRAVVPWAMIGLPLGVGLAALWPGTGGVPPAAHLALGHLAFAGAFLAADPCSSPRTPVGLGMHGLLIGFLAVLLRTTDARRPEGTVAALLLASMLAPLVDRAVRSVARSAPAAADA
jgi:Na+-translocating ferredoxin:NAD+ oxidoreductase RnfD subunit